VFSLLSDRFLPEERGRATTAAIVGQVIGNSAAFALGGTLLEHAAVSGTEAWRWAMGGLLIPLGVMLVLLLALKEPERVAASVKNLAPREIWRMLQGPGTLLLTLGLGVVLTETAVGAMLIWGSPMLARRFALHPDKVGAIMGFAMIFSGIVGPICGGFIADVCQRSGGRTRTLTALLWAAALTLPAGAFAFVPGVLSTSTVLIVDLALMLGIAVIAMALYTIVTPPGLQGVCMSVLMAGILFGALAVAPVAVSALSVPLGGLAAIGPALSAVCMVASVLAAAAFGLGQYYNLGNDQPVLA
jgi:MFS family permease